MLPWLAFFACSSIWGSTWLAHKWALVDFTPMGLASVRFVVAGLLCLAIAWLRGERFVRREQLQSLLLAGLLMAGAANVLTAWSLQYIPSGVGAVLQAPIPVWLALLSLRSDPMHAGSWIAVALGFVGVGLVMWPSEFGGIDPLAALVCTLTPIAWSWASLHQRAHVRSGGLFANAGVQMLFSGSVCVALTAGFGDFTQHGDIGPSAWWAVSYLIVGGSCIAFASYLYLARVWHPARAGSFSYINPVIAVLLGWLLGGEGLGSRLIAGMAVVLVAVAVLQLATRKRPPVVPPEVAGEHS
jgi:drug/metabolite transporter (DMT)-like permease